MGGEKPVIGGGMRKQGKGDVPVKGWRLKRTVVLVGMMGSGKTAIGKALALRLGCRSWTATRPSRRRRRPPLPRYSPATARRSFAIARQR